MREKKYRWIRKYGGSAKPYPDLTLHFKGIRKQCVNDKPSDSFDHKRSINCASAPSKLQAKRMLLHLLAPVWPQQLRWEGTQFKTTADNQRTCRALFNRSVPEERVMQPSPLSLTNMETDLKVAHRLATREWPGQLLFYKICNRNIC